MIIFEIIYKFTLWLFMVFFIVNVINEVFLKDLKKEKRLNYEKRHK